MGNTPSSKTEPETNLPTLQTILSIKYLSIDFTPLTPHRSDTHHYTSAIDLGTTPIFVKKIQLREDVYKHTLSDVLLMNQILIDKKLNFLKRIIQDDGTEFFMCDESCFLVEVDCRVDPGGFYVERGVGNGKVLQVLGEWLGRVHAVFWERKKVLFAGKGSSFVRDVFERLRDGDWESLLKKVRRAYPTLNVDFVRDAVSFVLEQEEYVMVFDMIPILGDCNLSNFVFNDDGVVSVFDFGCARKGLRVEDLWSALIFTGNKENSFYTPPAEELYEDFNSLISGYKETVWPPLSEAEVLSSFIIFIASSLQTLVYSIDNYKKGKSAFFESSVKLLETSLKLLQVHLKQCKLSAQNRPPRYTFDENKFAH